jgi:hypothetical protein
MPLVPLRTVTVSDPLTGLRWTVSEISAHTLPGSRGSTCLVFQAEGIARRVWHYPAHWADLPSPELCSLSWST